MRRSRNELYISEATVKTHVTHVLQKLKVRDRVQAVVLAYQTGLIESDALRSGRDETARTGEESTERYGALG